MVTVHTQSKGASLQADKHRLIVEISCLKKQNSTITYYPALLRPQVHF